MSKIILLAYIIKENKSGKYNEPQGPILYVQVWNVFWTTGGHHMQKIMTNFWVGD